MTREEQMKELQKIKESVEAKVTAYNDAYQDKRYDEADKLDAEMTELINKYTGIVRDLCFRKCKESGKPMIAAAKMLTYETIGVRDTMQGETKTKIKVREFVEHREKQIDPLRLQKFCGEIGEDKNWSHMIERFNMLLTAKKAVDLGIDPTGINDSYAMSDIARNLKMGKTPTSNSQILNTLRTVVSAMIGEEYAAKVTSHDVNFLISIYSKKSRKALAVTCANHKYMRGYLMEICHRVLTGKSYSVEYKQKK